MKAGSRQNHKSTHNNSDGSILSGNEVANGIPSAERDQAMMFLSYAQRPNMTVKQHLSFGQENLNTSKTQIDVKINQVVENDAQHRFRV